jgi:hypothetical protein
VSEWERKLFGLALPGFTDLDPQEQIRVIKDLRETMVSDMKSGRASPLSATPAMSQEMNRGAQQQGQTTPAQAAQPSGRPVSKAEYDALPSGAQYMAPDGKMRTKR